MKRIFTLVAFSSLFAAAPAWAQATRTWVSGVGDDANPCSRTAPCKTFAGAISKTAAAGEIDGLDPGGFGAVTITKSITIDGYSGLAGILVAGTNGITVNDSGANTAIVVLRNLDLDGFAVTGNSLVGVSVVSAKAVYIENCTIYGFTTGVTATGGAVYITNSIIRDNATANGTTANVLISGTATGALTHVFLSDSPLGLDVSGSATMSVYDSVFFAHTTYALHASGTAVINVDRSVVANNAIGVQSDDTSIIRLSSVMTGQNGTALLGSGTAASTSTGTIASFGNNRISAGNQTDGAPSNVIPLQ